MCFSVISVLPWCTWDQAPSVVHSPAFSVGCAFSCTLFRVQTGCLVNMHFSSVSHHYLAIHLSDPEKLEVGLWQHYCSCGLAHMTQEQPPRFLPVPSVLQILHLCVLQLCFLWNGHLCTQVSLWSRLWSEHRAQSFLLGWMYFGPGIRVGFASWAHFGVTYGACAHRNGDNDLILSSSNISSFTFLFFFFFFLGVTIANDSFKCCLWIWQWLMVLWNLIQLLELSKAKLFKLLISCELSYLDCWFSSTY